MYFRSKDFYYEVRASNPLNKEIIIQNVTSQLCRQPLTGLNASLSDP